MMELVIRQGGNADLEGAIQLLQEVKVSMLQQQWLYLDSPEEIRSMVDAGILKFWVAQEGENLAGVFYIIFPGLRGFNYGYDLDFTQEELLRAVSMDTVAIRPQYRGLGLQRKLIRAAEESLETGSILLCTVHPENSFSLNNALKLGYVIQKEIPKYGSTRYVLRKDL